MRLSHFAAKLTFVFSSALVLTVSAQDQSVPFSWDNATIYFAMTDRFANGDPSNDQSYNRGFDGAHNAYDATSSSRFLGGDFVGLTKKIEDGYFTELGVSAIWLSPPFEQVHGWVGSSGGIEQSYAYHGYWLLDPTEFDANFGTKREFAQLVETAHDRGIRIIVDVILNHPGYATMQDMAENDFGNLDSLWTTWRPSGNETWNSYHDLFIDYESPDDSDSTGWSNWWSSSWVRSGLPGYDACGSTDYTMCVSALPDFKTESSAEVGLPPILLSKWPSDKLALEQAELDSFFERTGLPRTPAFHMVKWITDMVREFGVDGFRLDTGKHVRPAVWNALLTEASASLSTYRNEHEVPPALAPTEFWSVAEIFGYAPGNTTAYDQSSIDAFLNFEIRHSDLLDIEFVDSLYSAYAEHVGSPEQKSFLSYISSHDEGLADRSNNYDLATRFVMLPGGIQLLYGDEVGRSPAQSISIAADSRSPMDWNSIDEDLLRHWQILASFRSRHPAVGAGNHERIQDNSYTYRRSLNYGNYTDNVVIVQGAEGRTRINVSKAFPDDTIVKDAYSGKTGFVTFGFVTMLADPSGVMLLEEVR